jgi:hypothetical protein
MPFFSSYPIPPEVVIDGDAVSLARPRIDPAAWLATFAGDEQPAADVERRAGKLPSETPARNRARAAEGG